MSPALVAASTTWSRRGRASAASSGAAGPERPSRDGHRRGRDGRRFLPQVPPLTFLPTCDGLWSSISYVVGASRDLSRRLRRSHVNDVNPQQPWHGHKRPAHKGVMQRYASSIPRDRSSPGCVIDWMVAEALFRPVGSGWLPSPALSHSCFRRCVACLRFGDKPEAAACAPRVYSGARIQANSKARVRVAMYSYIGADGPYPPEFGASMRSSSHHKGVALHPWLVPYRIVEHAGVSRGGVASRPAWLPGPFLPDASRRHGSKRTRGLRGARGRSSTVSSCGRASRRRPQRPLPRTIARCPRPQAVAVQGDVGLV
jgi:hypothetical protein